jgi:hypothetical protein
MDVRAILDRLESAKLVRLNKVSGDYMTCYCPFHSSGNEKKPSCGVLLVDQWRNGQHYPEGWWHCFSCGYVNDMASALTDILKNHSISKSGLDWLKENIPGFDVSADLDLLVPDTLIQDLSNQFAINYLKAAQNAPAWPIVSEGELASYRFIVPYMYERHLTDAVIEQFDVGYDANWIPPGRSKPVPCITIPVRDKEGRTLFLCRRSIQGKMYNYPEGVTKPVFGVDMIPPRCKSLIICESAINALTCWTWGYPAVALLGTGNAYQLQQLRELGVPEFVLCMDGDDAGSRAAAKLKRQLSDVAIIWTVRFPPGKDVNDVTKEEFDKLYSERE